VQTLRGRKANSGVRPSKAARCRRRKTVGSVAAFREAPPGSACHHSTATMAPDRSACSAAQAASAALSGQATVNHSGAKPKAARAGPCGRQGGATHNQGPPANAGASKDNSPLPGAGSSSSVKPAAGQPPPGSSASRAAWPVLRCRAPRLPGPPPPSCPAIDRSSWSARHNRAAVAAGRQSAARKAAAALRMAADVEVVRQWGGRHCEVLFIYTVF
jgi:hypothetical protein